MCGRFTFSEFEGIDERFQIQPQNLKYNYNVAPTQDVPAVRGCRVIGVSTVTVTWLRCIHY